MIDIILDLKHILKDEENQFSQLDEKLILDLQKENYKDIKEKNCKLKMIVDDEYRKGRLSISISINIEMLSEKLIDHIKKFIEKNFSNYKIYCQNGFELDEIYKLEYEFYDSNNLLIVGNGFDLAHGLKTTYKDFLNNCKELMNSMNKSSKKIEHYLDRLIDENIVNELEPFFNDRLFCDVNFIYNKKRLFNKEGIRTEIKKFIEKKYYNLYLPLEILCDFYIDKSIEKYYKHKEDNIFLIDKFIKYFLSENVLLKYLLDSYEENGELWIDIEKEISMLVKDIEQIKKEKIILLDKNYKLFNVLLKQKNRSNEEEYNIDIKGLEENLDIIIYLLEEYLSSLKINDNDIQKIKNDIKNSFADNITYLLSFNYTDTFRETYIPKKCILYNEDHVDFIHGQLGKHNLVFGTNETLHDESKNKNLDCIYFKKYFQRIYKKTGCKYKKWLNEGIDNVYIYGHSLDVTDKDVINEVIQKSKHVIIYYHSEEAYRQQITNLVKVLEHGQDDLVEMVYGIEPKIEFKPTF